MEGNKPAGCLVLVKYIQLKASMEEKSKQMHNNNPLYPILEIMINKGILYLVEALKCNTLVLAAVFQPGLGAKFCFSLVWGRLWK